MNKRIALSGLSILTALALIGGATFAFFSDVETSHDNVLQAGALDLTIDNSSYYNRVLQTLTSWQLSDLTNQVFFAFRDLKPGDEGEDTISLHVTNDSWACMDLLVNNSADNGCGGSEVDDDPTCVNPPDQGELDDELNFMFWGDDGDNVLEEGEVPFLTGPASDVLNKAKITLADSHTNNLGIGTSGPMLASHHYFIGKAWCFGKLTEHPVAAGQGVSPAVDPGVLCDGSLVNNASQTDSLTGDISFRAEQARNNSGFLCNPQPTPTPNGGGG